MTIRELFVKLGFQVDDAKLKTADAALKAYAETAKAVGIALAGSAAALGFAVRQTAAHAEQILKAAATTGQTTDEVQALGFAAEQSETSLDALMLGARNLSRIMQAAASGSGEARKALAAIGVRATDTAGKLRPTQDVLADVADRFATMPDGAEKTATAMALFGRSGTDLLRFLSGGGAQLREAQARFRALGLTLKRDDLEAANALGDKFGEVQTVLASLRDHVVLAFGPMLTRLANWFEGVVVRVRNAVDAFGDAEKGVRLLGLAVATYLGVRAVQAIGPLVAAIRGVQWSLLVANATAVALPALITAAVLAVALVAEDIYGWMHGIDSIAGRMISRFVDAPIKPEDHWMVRTLRAIAAVLRDIQPWFLLWEAGVSKGNLAAIATGLRGMITAGLGAPGTFLGELDRQHYVAGLVQSGRPAPPPREFVGPPRQGGPQVRVDIGEINVGGGAAFDPAAFRDHMRGAAEDYFAQQMRMTAEAVPEGIRR